MRSAVAAPPSAQRLPASPRWRHAAGVLAVVGVVVIVNSPPYLMRDVRATTRPAAKPYTSSTEPSLLIDEDAAVAAAEVKLMAAQHAARAAEEELRKVRGSAEERKARGGGAQQRAAVVQSEVRSAPPADAAAHLRAGSR